LTNEANRNDEYGPPALLALVRFLAKYQDESPVIQGTANQIALKRIGELDYDAQAVKAMLANNSPAKGKAS
jgi:hypothetical protein